MRPRIVLAALAGVAISASDGERVVAQVLLGDRTDYAVPRLPVSIELADLNGDGLDDIVVGSTDSVSILTSLGPTMGPPVARSGPYYNQVPDVAAADLNADGLVDVIASNLYYGRVDLYAGTSSGEVDYTGPIPVGDNPTRVCIVDLNKDGLGDIVSANQGSNSVSVCFGKPFVWFRPHIDYSVGPVPLALGTGDFDGNGWTDLAVVTTDYSDTVSSALSVFRSGRGGEGFFQRLDISIGAGAQSLCIADCDGDSILDCVIGMTSCVDIYRGTGDGGFSFWDSFGSASQVIAVETADLDRDGYLELVGVSQWTNSIFVLQGLGAGGFGHQTNYSAGSGTFALDVGDTDGDGLTDVAAVNFNGGTVTLWRNLSQVAGIPGMPEAGELPPRLHISPTPFSEATAITFSLSQPGRVRLTVHDVAGRHVASLMNTDLDEGNHRVSWSGLSDQGSRVPPGVYFTRMWTPNQVLTGRIVFSP